MSGKLIVVVGGQFGSEAKGHVTEYLARKADPKHGLMSIRVAGSNAGHTVYDDNGNRLALRHVPVGVVLERGQLALAAGSEIDPEVLEAEIHHLEGLGHSVRSRLLIDPQATVITPDHQAAETYITTGTTGKGIGAARAARLLRQADTVASYDGMWLGTETNVATEAKQVLHEGGTVIIEGTQGFGLGLHAGWYPHSTSSDCRATDFLAMAGLSPWASYVRDFEVWVVYRVHPIRIAGNSGPLYGETTWDELRIKPEFTTVTKKMRRVGLWDEDLAQRAFIANGGPSPYVYTALMFLDYAFPELKGRSTVEAVPRGATMSWLKALAKGTGIDHFSLLGTGPFSMINLRES